MTLNVEDKSLRLPSGRNLAYADNGDRTSSTVVLWLNGAFGIGDARNPARVLKELNVHFVSASLPGWGATSPATSPAAYPTTVMGDMTALLNHLHPDTSSYKLYLSGGSFGTAAAQMLYCAPYSLFLPGRQIGGLLLLAPFSPFRVHTAYASTLSWSSYVSVGPPVKLIPYRLHVRLAKLAIAPKTKNEDVATKFIKSLLFDKMGDAEKAELKRWRSEQIAADGTLGLPEGELERSMAANMVKSVAHSWEGFFSMSEILHGDWGGANPQTLDEEHSKAPVLAVVAEGDDIAGRGMGEWLAKNYKNGGLKVLQGGHIAGLLQSDEIWQRFMDICIQ